MRYAFGDCVLDTELHELRRTGVPVKLQRKVYQVLAYLVEQRARLVTKAELLDHLWPGVYVVTGERWCEPDLYRLKGELLLACSPEDHTEAEICLQHALALARRQQARSWELRTALILARLWLQHDRQEGAHQLLAEVYNRFTEGFDTADLQEAKALLEALT